MAEPWPDPAACTAFDEASAELALGLLDPAESDALLAHVAECDRCRLELDALVSTADRLTLLAPEAEPPGGFERKALASMGRSGSHRSAWLVAAAAAVIIAVAGGVVVGRWSSSNSPSDSVASGVLATSNGDARGVVAVVRGDDPSLVMSLTGVDPGGTYHCAVRTPDGRVTEVAAWTIPGSGGGTWRVALPRRLASATEAIVTEHRGTPVATAVLH